jgi:hypothetical protein
VCWSPSAKRMFVSMDVTFRESGPFYGELTDLSLLFAELDHLDSVKDGQEGEKDVSTTQGDSVGTKTDDDVCRLRTSQLWVQLRLVPQVPVRGRWQENTLVYSRRQPQVQGEQQGSDTVTWHVTRWG